MILPIKTDRKNKVGQAGQQSAKLLMAVTPVSWFFFIIVLILITWWSLKAWSGEGEPKLRAKGYFRREYGEQMEINIRLPYKRFKEI